MADRLTEEVLKLVTLSDDDYGRGFNDALRLVLVILIKLKEEQKMSEVLKNRYEFSILFDVTLGNPNGDPDTDNMPRTDIDNSFGIVSDACLKRKVRDYVDIVYGDKKGFNIYIKDDKVSLNSKEAAAFESLGVDSADAKATKKSNPDFENKLIDYMCSNFFDIRAFGAVMTTFAKSGLGCSAVRGPVQFGFARSIDPVTVQEICITRVCITKDEDLEHKNNEIGRKYVVPYGLYRVDGYISAFFAKKTGFTEDDLKVFFEACVNMFEHDHSAARGNMFVRKVVAFKHDSPIGCAPSDKVFEALKVHKKDGVKAPASFDDYDVKMGALPDGVSVIVLR